MNESTDLYVAGLSVPKKVWFARRYDWGEHRGNPECRAGVYGRKASSEHLGDMTGITVPSLYGTCPGIILFGCHQPMPEGEPC